MLSKKCNWFSAHKICYGANSKKYLVNVFGNAVPMTYIQT